MKQKQTTIPQGKTQVKTKTVEEYLNFSIEQDHVKLKNKQRYFYSFPASNLDLMNDFLIEELVQNLGTVLNMMESVDVYSFNIFSYQEGTSFSENIAFREKRASQESNKKKYELLKKQILDLQSLEKLSTEKSFVLYFDMHRTQNNNLSLIVDLLKKAAPTGYLLKRDELEFLYNAYFLKELSKSGAKRPTLEYPKNIDFTMNYYNINGYFRKTITVSKYPTDGNDGAFSRLAQIENVHLNIKYERTSDDISELINDEGMRSSRKLSSGKAADQIDGERNIITAKSFYNAARDGNSSLVRTFIFIEMVARTVEELNKLQQQVSTELNILGFTKDLCKLRQHRAFASVQPFGENELRSKYRSLTTDIAASFYPMSYESKNDSEGIIIGKISHGSYMSVDFSKRDKDNPNGNMAIIGMSGTGKTHMIKNILTQQASFGYRTIAFDSDNSEYKPTIENIGGVEMNASTGNIMINPFEPRFIGYDEDEEESNTSIMSFHESWLLSFFKMRKHFTESETDHLEIFINQFYQDLGFVTNKDVEEKTPPIASDFYRYVETANVGLVTTEERRKLLNRIYSICLGADKTIFNGQTNFKAIDIMSINTQALILGDQGRAQAQLYNIITYIFMQSVKDNYPTILAIDELYLFLNKEYPMMAIEIRNWFKRCRKYNAIGLFGTQNLDDVMQPGLKEYTAAIISNCNNHFIFKPGAKEVDVARETFKLSNKETQKIIHARRGEYLFLHGKNKYFVEAESTDKMTPHLLKSVAELIV